jgi:hypothetical protein
MSRMAEWEYAPIELENERIAEKYNLVGDRYACSNCGFHYEIQEGQLIEDSPNHLSFICLACLIEEGKTKKK